MLKGLTSKIIILIGSSLLILNIYSIFEGYEYTHVDEIRKRDGQYGMVYSFYMIIVVFNFILCTPLFFYLIKNKLSQDKYWYNLALVCLVINPILILVGTVFLD